jgi:PiT family inorganic phosphate transporter
LVGFALGALFMVALLWTIKGLTRYAHGVPTGRQAPGGVPTATGGTPTPTLVAAPTSTLRRRVHAIVQPTMLNRIFRYAQTVSAAAMAVGHGMQDAAKTMGIIVLALYIGGFQQSPTHIPWWVYYTSATVLALGTYAGGWRIIRTLGRRIIHLGPMEGFAAESVASSVLYFTAFYGAPISTTQTITSAIMGVGTTKKFSAVRWGVAGNILTAWVLTFPGAGLLACVVSLGVGLLF